MYNASEDEYYALKVLSKGYILQNEMQQVRAASAVNTHRGIFVYPLAPSRDRNGILVYLRALSHDRYGVFARDFALLFFGASVLSAL